MSGGVATTSGAFILELHSLGLLTKSVSAVDEYGSHLNI
jgi:hypothetical protein